MGWQNFFWVPFFEGKGFYYYQFMAMVGSLIMFLLGCIFMMLHLVTAKFIDSPLTQLLASKNSLLLAPTKKLTGLWFSHSLMFLSYFFFGMIGTVNSALGIINDFGGFFILATALILFSLHRTA